MIEKVSFLVTLEVPKGTGAEIVRGVLVSNVERVSEHFGGSAVGGVPVVFLVPEHRVKQIVDVLKATDRASSAS